MKYRKKPVVIEAVQLTGNNIREAYEFINGPVDLSHPIANDKWYDYEDIVKRDGLRIMTLESDGQTQIADIGDFIIRGVQGEHYPCKPDIFEQTYESVE